MSNRNRKKRIEFCVSEEEYAVIQKKMALTNAKSMRVYLTRMAIHGYMVEVDFSGLERIATELSRIGNNVNQLSRTSKTRNIYENDLRSIKEELATITEGLSNFWGDLNHTLEELA